MRTIILSALALTATATTAMAGLSSVQMTDIDLSSLTMPVDDAWTGEYGNGNDKADSQDWGYVTVMAGGDGDTIWIDEIWTGDLSANVIGIDLYGGRDARADTVIKFNKEVINVTGYTWTGFQMDLSTGVGTVNVLTSSSSDYGSTIVTNNNTNNVTMTYSAGAVANGDTANFYFEFAIPLQNIWSFTITQTPVPAPASLGLVGMAGLVAMRRRR